TPAGVVSANTVGFSADKIPMYTVTTDAAGITSIVEGRPQNLPTFGDLSKSAAGGGTIILTADEARAPIIEVTGALPNDTTIVFPAVKRSWIINNNTSGAFTLTCKVNGQTGIVAQQGRRSIIYCDGTDIRPALTDFAQTMRHTVWVPAAAMVARLTG